MADREGFRHLDADIGRSYNNTIAGVAELTDAADLKTQPRSLLIDEFLEFTPIR